MIITIAGFKGGVGKTTTAVHLAAHLQKDAPTLLIDGDPNRSATGWAKRGSLPFKVVDELQAARYARDFEHIVIDTKARPEPGDLETLADGCDLLVIPTTPDALALEALMLTVSELRQLGNDRYRVLLTVVPPPPSHDADDARADLTQAQIPTFETHVRRYVAYQKAALQGVPVYESADPRAQVAWEDYLAVGKELLP